MPCDRQMDEMPYPGIHWIIFCAQISRFVAVNCDAFASDGFRWRIKWIKRLLSQIFQTTIMKLVIKSVWQIIIHIRCFLLPTWNKTIEDFIFNNFKATKGSFRLDRITKCVFTFDFWINYGKIITQNRISESVNAKWTVGTGHAQRIREN